jgi:hypothetical protein
MSNKTKVIKVPSVEEFANHLGEVFLKEENLRIDLQKDETIYGAILSVPDVNAKFTLWLCSLVHQTSFDDIASPHGEMLN